MTDTETASPGAHPGSTGADRTLGAVGPVARLDDVFVSRAGATLVHDVTLTLERGRPMALLGPNGAGKTTLLRILATRLFPTSGRVEVLGATFGRADLRTLRHRIGFASVTMDRLLPASQPIGEMVAAARRGILRSDHRVTAQDREAAAHALHRIGVGELVDRSVRTCSQGEWQRVQIARALVAEPDLLLLDEPAAGLDLGGRESLVADLDDLLSAPGAPATVVVTHHLEELPSLVADATLLRDGRVVATGPAGDVLTDGLVSRAFDVPVAVARIDGRWTARVRRR